jgi:hypothetical protein
MRLGIRNPQELLAGVLFLAFGGFVLAYARNYPMGTATQMGPGYFPTVLASLLCALGAINVVKGLRATQVTSIGTWPLVPLAFVIAGVLAFAALITDHGLFPAVIAVLLLGCYDRLFRRPLEVAAICVIMLALAWAVFIYAIDLPIDLW